MEKEKFGANAKNVWKKFCFFSIYFVLIGLIGSLILSSVSILNTLSHGTLSTAFINWMRLFFVFGIFGMIGCIPKYLAETKNLWKSKKYGAVVSIVTCGICMLGLTLLWAMWSIVLWVPSPYADLAANIAGVGILLLVGGAILWGLSYVVCAIINVVKSKLQK